MEDIRLILDQPRETQTKWKFTSRRQELVQQYVDHINVERQKTPYPPVTAKRLNSQYLWPLDEWELEVFFKKCKASRCFGKCFFGCLKTHR